MCSQEPKTEQFGVRELHNIKSGRSYFLVPAHAIPPSAHFQRDIQTICNEPRIYELLFRPRLLGTPYPSDMAAQFLEWAQKGWNDRSHFVFLITNDTRSAICGSIDIKSNNLESGEIGYWASQNHSGIITPAIDAICSMARNAGYKALHAFVDPANFRSTSALVRNGFVQEPETTIHKSKPCLVFRLPL